MSWLLAALVATSVAAPPLKDPPKPSKVVVYQRITVEELEAMLTDKGWAFETSRTTGRDTFLRVSLGAYKGVIVLSDGGSGKATDLHLYAGFQTPDTPTPLVINQWNQARRFCRAYVDSEGDPVLEADVDLGGGVLAEHVVQQLEIFASNVQAFAKHIGFGASEGR